MNLKRRNIIIPKTRENLKYLNIALKFINNTRRKHYNLQNPKTINKHSKTS